MLRDFYDVYWEIAPVLAALWLLPPLGIWVVSFALPDVAGRRRTVFLAVLAVSTTAVATGYLAGASREAVMGDVLPILLTGFGAVASYAVIQNKISIEVAAMGVILFGTILFVSTLWGTQARNYYGSIVEPSIEGVQ